MRKFGAKRFKISSTMLTLGVLTGALLFTFTGYEEAFYSYARVDVPHLGMIRK